MNARASIAPLLACLLTTPIWASDQIQFNRDVRPLLADNCFQCHGPDSKTRHADLRLDTESGLAQAGLIVAGDPESSQLIQRIESSDVDLHMPPADSHKQLTDGQIQKIKDWVRQGAAYQSHWSFLPLQQPSTNLSDLDNANAIDWLIDRQISDRNLVAAAPADKTTLLRRLHFDLIGLPPSPDEVTQFLADSSEQAVNRQVERLLASQHFGERMAMWWLDLVRYADTVGYHGDQDMSVWPFRDYVIESFNANKPFNQFTVEQLAGDLLPNASKADRIASGYNRLGMMSAEGGVQDKEYLAKYIAERVRNVSGTWLGITMGCCECHDHKFDSLTSREFYEMEAFFADIKEQGLYAGSDASGKWGTIMQVPSAAQEQELSKLVAAIASAEAKYNEPTADLATSRQQWETLQQQWSILKPSAASSKQAVTLTVQPDGSVLASGNNPDTDTYTLSFESIPAGITALRVEAMPDDSFPQKGPGRAGNGNFVLSEFVAKVDSAAASNTSLPNEPVEKSNTPADGQSLEFCAAAASYEQTGAAGGNPYGKWAVAAAIDKDVQGAKWGWAVMEQVGRRQFAVFQLSETLQPTSNQRLTIELHQHLDNPQHTLGRFRIWALTTKIATAQEAVVPAEIFDLIETPAEKRTAEQQNRLTEHYKGTAPQLQPLRDELASLKKAKAELDSRIPITLVTETVAPRTIRVLPRGNWMDESGSIVEPALPAAIRAGSSQFPTDRRLNRLDLAQWIVARENPLTARVFVNRVWKIFFGVGLARKLDDLGAQGEPPSHPELLDFLALRFVESGWDVKQLITTIVATRAYQRSSTASPESLAIDPQNVWLSRQGRFRLDAELVRDNALAVSGLLVKQVGGKSVKPYQPPGYWAYLNFPPREWANGNGEELYRRGLYTHWQRQYLHPSLMAFDAPNREECTADRPRSNTPLQSLALLNDPTYVEAARAFAARLLVSTNNDQSRIQLAFQTALSRMPTDAEVKLVSELLDRARQQYAGDEANAKQFLSIGAFSVGSEISSSELAAWSTATRAILNLHEALTRN